MPRSNREPLPWSRLSYRDFLDDPQIKKLRHRAPEAGFPLLELFRAAWEAELRGWRPGYLPADGELLASIAGLNGEWEAIAPALALAFDTTSEPGWWIQKRIVREYEHSRRVSAVRAVAGAAGGRAFAERMQSKRRAIAPERLEVREVRENLESTPSAPRSAKKPADSSPEAFSIEATDGFVPVSQLRVENWQAAYPGVDVLLELRKAAAWQDSNPRDRKTSRGMFRFLNGWLNRAQNSHRIIPIREDDQPSSFWPAEVR